MPRPWTADPRIRPGAKARRRASLAAPFAALVVLLASPCLVAGGDRGGAPRAQSGPSLARPAAGPSPAERLDFRLGQALFERTWVAAPASTDSADGLGPLYNARSCTGCHPGSGRGMPWTAQGPSGKGLVLRLALPPGIQGGPAEPPGPRPREQGPRDEGPGAGADPIYGAQLQTLALPGLRPEGRISVLRVETEVHLSDGEVATLVRPIYGVDDLGYGPLDPQTRVSPRLAPQPIGLGALESVPESAILELADPQDRDGDGISGRPNLIRNPESGSAVLGRFGWKAALPSLSMQVQSAFHLDLGISTGAYPQGAGDCTLAEPDCLAAPQGGSPRHAGVEAGPEVVRLVTLYVQGLAVPDRPGTQGPGLAAGESLFRRIGCAGCHRPELASGAPHAGPIRPYTDLLLHDLGEGLADGPPEGEAQASEWRTPPLRGLRLVAGGSATAAYLHDGRARSLLEAVLWHGGEALASRDAVVSLPSADRADLLRFLESL